MAQFYQPVATMDTGKYVVRHEGRSTETSAPSLQAVGDRSITLSGPTYEASSFAEIFGYVANSLLTSFVCALFGAISFAIGVLFDVRNILNMDPKGTAILQGALGGALVSPLALIASLIHYHHSIRHADPPVDDTDLWMYHKRVFLSYRHLFYMLIAGCLAGGVGYAATIGGARILDAAGLGSAGGVIFTVVTLILLALRYISCPSRNRRAHRTWSYDCRARDSSGGNCSSGCDCSGCDCSGCDCSGCDCSGCVVVLIVVAGVVVAVAVIASVILFIITDE